MHTTKPTLSLITVCKNGAATIGRTLSSVAAQQGEGIEYLVVDGGSTDSTLAIVRECSCVDQLVSEPDYGISDAFNKGINRSTGEIVGLINADDQLALDALAFVRTYFADHPEVEVLHGDVLLQDRGRTLKRLKPAGRWWYPWRLVLFNHPATFVRRRVYEQYGLFDTNYRIAMDAEMFFRWMSHGIVIRYVPQVLAIMESGGVSGQQATAGYREVRQAAVRHGYCRLLSTVNFWGKMFGWSVLGYITQYVARFRP